MSRAFAFWERSQRILCVAVGFCSVAAGCASGPGAGPKAPPEADTSLATLTSNQPATIELPDPRTTLTDAEKERWAAQAALDLELVLSQAQAAAQTRDASSAAAEQTAGDALQPTSSSLASNAQSVDDGPVQYQLPTIAAETPPGASSPTAANSGLNALTQQDPGDDLRAASQAGELPPPGKLEGAGENSSNQTNTGKQSQPPLRIARAALCSRVEGFGKYRPMASNVFVAGRSVRAIVYVELEGFQSRSARSGDPIQPSLPLDGQHTVELSQAVTLFADSDGVIAWQRPAQRAIETTATPRRDFYLIQIIELPPTLSIGRYNLKVTVRDVTTSQQAESVIQLTIVGDPSASQSNR